VSKRFYAGASDALNGPMDPKTPCRNMETRPCVILDPETPGVETKFPKRECLPHECQRFADRYEQGEIPHQWARDEDGDLVNIDLGDYHDGPYCTRCERAFCRNCEDPGLMNAVCEVQDEALF
jgi:hypothetical protein